MVDALEDSFPSDLDPESDAGLARYASLPLDAYAAQDPAEFLAVASEAYFMAPDQLQLAFTPLFDLLDRYYRPSISRVISRVISPDCSPDLRQPP